MIEKLVYIATCTLVVWAGCIPTIIFANGAEPDVLQTFKANRTGTPLTNITNSSLPMPDCDDPAHTMDKFCFDPSVQEVINR